MPAPYAARVTAFAAHSDEYVIGCLANAVTASGTEITSEQLLAWREEITLLKKALSSDTTRDWHLLLEFPIPRRGKRIDAVLLTLNLVVVIEFKCGARTFGREAQSQVEDYCLDLRDFHCESRNRLIVPVLVVPAAHAKSATLTDVVDCVAPVWFANERSLGSAVQSIVDRYEAQAGSVIDPSAWNNAEYLPTPTIVEAARALYGGQNVREITRCHAGAENLTRTSVAVTEAIDQARRNGRKLICFVTGVPGSGKTLAGLNVCS